MITFILILAGLICFNFILLKFSIQSVDSDKKRKKDKNIQATSTIGNNSDIPKAA